MSEHGRNYSVLIHSYYTISLIWVRGVKERMKRQPIQTPFIFAKKNAGNLFAMFFFACNKFLDKMTTIRKWRIYLCNKHVHMSLYPPLGKKRRELFRYRRCNHISINRSAFFAVLCNLMMGWWSQPYSFKKQFTRFEKDRWIHFEDFVFDGANNVSAGCSLHYRSAFFLWVVPVRLLALILHCPVCWFCIGCIALICVCKTSSVLWIPSLMR